MDFDETWYLSFFFQKSIEIVEVLLKFYKNNGFFTWRRFTFMTLFRWMLFRMTNVLIKSVEKIKTQILYSITIFRRSYRLRDNVEKHGGARETAGLVKLHARKHTPALTHPHVRTHSRARAHTQNKSYLFFFHGNNAFVNALPCYVMPTLPVLLSFLLISLLTL